MKARMLTGLVITMALVGCSSSGGSATPAPTGTAGKVANGGGGATNGAGDQGTGNQANAGSGNAGSGNTANAGAGNSANTSNAGAGNTANTGNAGTGNTSNAGAGNSANTGNAGTGNTANTGNAGSGNTGNAGTAGSAGAGGTLSGKLQTQAGGYVTSVNWKGYAWTATSGAGTTIIPSAFTSLLGGQPLCAQGSVALLADYSGVAMLGINVNQGSTANSPVGTYTPVGTGINYNITNTGASALRIQLQDASGTAAGRWCAPVTGTTGFIPWASFNTTCWTTGGVPYNGTTPLTAVLVTVPGGLTAAVSYNFCVNDLNEQGASTGGSCSPACGPGQTCFASNGVNSCGNNCATNSDCPVASPCCMPLSNGGGVCSGDATFGCKCTTGTNCTGTKVGGTACVPYYDNTSQTIYSDTYICKPDDSANGHGCITNYCTQLDCMLVGTNYICTQPCASDAVCGPNGKCVAAACHSYQTCAYNAACVPK